MRFWAKGLIFHFAKISGLFYLTPINLSYWWNFGVFSLYFLLAQLVTGIVLAMFYNPSATLAYSVIMELNNEVYYGWWIRYLHANGASLFFLSVYLHMFRGLYYCSFLHPRQMLWISGIIILLLMIITAFLGYILPWGQMSFWGAMVITSLLAAIPLIGSDFIFLLWGGYSIDDATLHRFYSLHFTFPFLIFAMAIIHVLFLHEYGSTNPTGLVSISDTTPFTPYYVLKDIYSIIIVLIILNYLITMYPDYLGHPVNYERANFLSTPAHIVPEWYLLFFYAILRSVTSKLLGFFFMACSIIILVVIPLVLKGYIIRSSMFKPWHAFWFWFFICTCILLCWIGSLPVISPFLGVGQFLSVFYFAIILIFFPIGVFIERLAYDAFVYEAEEMRLNRSLAKFPLILFYWVVLIKDLRDSHFPAFFPKNVGC